MTTTIKLSAAQTKLGITAASWDEDRTEVKVGDRLFEQLTDDSTPEDFVSAVADALKAEASGFEGILPNEAVAIEQLRGEDHMASDFVARLVIDGKPAGELARDPVLADMLTTLAEEEDTLAQVAGIRTDGDGEEEDERTGSVVPDVFKKRYAEAGHPGHCGDWLALTLNKLCQTMDGKKTITDLDRLEAIAAANDVTPDRVDRLGTATNGWQGRYRMTVRNMLAKKVADKGFLFVPEGCGVDEDKEMRAPKDWCAKYATKVKAKAPAKAAVAKDEGAGKASAKTAAKGKAPAKPADADAKPAKAKRGTKAEKAGVTA